MDLQNLLVLDSVRVCPLSLPLYFDAGTRPRNAKPLFALDERTNAIDLWLELSAKSAWRSSVIFCLCDVSIAFLCSVEARKEIMFCSCRL